MVGNYFDGLPPPQNNFDVNTLSGKKKHVKMILGFYDVFYDDLTPRSAIATQLTTEVTVWNVTKGGHSLQDWRKSQVHHQEILHNAGFARAVYYFLLLVCCFLGLMRCES